MATDVVNITAATGIQASALIRALSTHSSQTSTPITLHALTRSPTSPAAQSLRSYAHFNCDIKLFKADFDDIEPLKSAAVGCTSAFLNVKPVFTDHDAEKRHANNVISALVTAASATMHRLVYASAFLADTTVPFTVPPGRMMSAYIETKSSIKAAARRAADENNWDWTVLQPASFLNNFLPPTSLAIYPDLKASRKIAMAYTPEQKLGVINTEDLGRFAAAALTWTGEKYEKGFKGKRVPVANDSLTMGQLVEMFNEQLRLDPKAQGIQVTLEYLDESEVQKLKDESPLIEIQSFQLENPRWWM